MPLTQDCLLPYESTQRDITSPELWQRSLERSRHRREIAELGRRYSARRKSVSAVVSAAMLAAPAMPRIAMAQDGASGADRTEQPTGGQSAVILRLGTTGPGVSELQKRLGGLVADGIFGPKTAAAVRDFQVRHGLAVTGVVEMETWAALFGSGVSVLDESSPQAQEILARGASRGPEPASTLAGAQAASAKADTVAAAIAPASAATAAPPAPASARQPRALKEDTAPPPPEAAKPVATRPVATAPAPPAPQPPARKAPASTPTTGGDGPCSPGQFVSPVSNYSVSGTFGEDRGDHIHTGLDMVVPSGTPIHAASCGRVTDASSAGAYGNLVCIRHSGGFSTCYAHLSRFGASAGQYVRVGQIIGYVGCTGNCSGPHVHYEVRYHGTPRNPSPYVKARRASTSRASTPSRTRALKATSRSTRASRPAERSPAVTAAAQPPAAAPGEVAAPAEPAPESQPPVAPEPASVGAGGADGVAGADGAAGTDGADAAPASEPAPAEAAPAAETAPVDPSASEAAPPEAAAEPVPEAPATDVASPVDSLPAVTAQDSAPAEPPAPESQASDPKPPSDQASTPEPEKPAVEPPAVPAIAAEAAAAVPAAATEAAASAKDSVTDAASAAMGSATQEEPAASAAASDGADSPSAPAEPAAGSPTPAR